MGRTKNVPVKNKKTAADSAKASSKKPTNPRFHHTIRFPKDLENCSYLGDIWIGKTSNVLPFLWEKCGINFKELEEDVWTAHLHFDHEELVIVTLTNDAHFIRGTLLLNLGDYAF